VRSGAGAHRRFFRLAQDSLTAHAEHEFRLAKTDKAGITLRAHLLQVQKMIGRPPEGLIGPPMPTRVVHIWEMFLSLHSGRSYNVGGPSPLSWSDMKAWADLTNADLKDWEVHAIKALDSVWLRIVSEDRDNG
jgi:hypothetical protein